MDDEEINGLHSQASVISRFAEEVEEKTTTRTSFASVHFECNTSSKYVLRSLQMSQVFIKLAYLIVS